MSGVENPDQPELRKQLTQAREALQRSEQVALAGRFAGAIMHEINNPLEAITNLLYLARLQAHEPERVKCYVQQAEEQLELVRAIARQTLSFYREQHREHEFDVVELLENALRIHTTYLLEKQVDIQRRLPETLVMLGNSGELLQVLSNLIVNALEALSHRGKLYLRARSGNEEVHITVAVHLVCSLTSDDRIFLLGQKGDLSVVLSRHQKAVNLYIFKARDRCS
jgi:signal transduction histidine kinase